MHARLSCNSLSNTLELQAKLNRVQRGELDVAILAYGFDTSSPNLLACLYFLFVLNLSSI